MKIIGKSNQKGQTVVEYILMLVVMVTIITSILSYIKAKYIGDLTKCASAPNNKTMMCKINNILMSSGGEKKFQYYRFK